MRLVTRLWIGVTAAATLSVVAQAADYRPPVSKKPAITWTGWYVGASAGYGWSNSHVDPRGNTAFCTDTPGTFGLLCTNFAPPFTTSNTLSTAQAVAIPPSLVTHPSGALVGGHIGYDYQSGSVVYGIETDISWTNINGSNSQSGSAFVFPNFAALGIGGVSPVVNAQAIAEQHLRYFGTVRGRIGYLPADSLLLFATGGLAYGQVKSSTNIGESIADPFGICFCGPVAPALGSLSQTRVGWTVGFGAEFILPQQEHWSFKAEYLYFNLGNISYQSTLTLNDAAGVPLTAVAVSSSSTFTGSLFRAGFNYRFGAY
jgi:outer membrane immunogenic protein